MKRLKKGPELKMPELKVPTFFADLFYDLRDRRLLPVVALVVVAIVAVPFLLGEESDPLAELPPELGLSERLESPGERTAKLAVVEATPGLRDYRKRLEDKTPTNPFKQRYTAPVLRGAKLGGGDGEGSGGGEKKSTSPTDGGTDGGTTPGGSGGGAPVPGPVPGRGAVFFDFALNLRVVRTTGSEADGNKQTTGPEVRKRMLPTASLPNNNEQVVTYMGLSPKTKVPVFLVSTEVTGTFGEGKCVAGADTCQLIEIEAGFPQTFVYGEDGDRLKIKIISIEAVVTGRVGADGDSP